MNVKGRRERREHQTDHSNKGFSVEERGPRGKGRERNQRLFSELALATGEYLGLMSKESIDIYIYNERNNLKHQ